MKICHICSERNEDGALSCAECGATLTGIRNTINCQQIPAFKTRLVKTCNSCGAVNISTSNACRKCGANLTGLLPSRIKTIKAKRIFLIDCQGVRHMVKSDGGSIGRGSIFDSPYVSQDHISISYDGQDYLLMDLGSRNGTCINNEEIEPGMWTAIAEGDKVKIANLTYDISVEAK